MHRHLAALTLATLSAPALAGTIDLRWDAVSGATGYRVYHGTQSGQFGTPVDAHAATTARLDNLADCTEHFVVVRAYGSTGESGPSNEVSGWPRPRIASHDPATTRQGVQYTLNIRGANFESGASLIVDPASLPVDYAGNPLLRFESARVLSCTQLQVLVTVEATSRGFRAMETGPVSLPFEVVNPDGVFGTAQGVLQINFSPHRADINRTDAATRDRVDGKDLSWLAYSHGSGDGALYYNPDADLDGDGLVDGQDLALLAPFFGHCWSASGWSAAACP